MGSTPINPRAIEYSDYFNIPKLNENVLSRTQSLYEFANNTRALELEDNLDFTSDFRRVDLYDKKIIDLSLDVDLTCERSFDRSSSGHFHELDFLNRASLSLTYALLLDQDRDGGRDWKHYKTRERNLEKEREKDRTQVLSRIFNFFIDIRTLQERIAGRSPAFEGIRLVKERIK